jgi:hypothetical protein
MSKSRIKKAHLLRGSDFSWGGGGGAVKEDQGCSSKTTLKLVIK